MILAITVTGKDRPGIVAALTGALYRAGGNLEDASMTILEGEFAMIFLAALPNQSAQDRFSSTLNELETKSSLVISMKEIRRRLIRGEKHGRGTSPWTISVLGKDRAGIVYFVSKLLADFKLNITDLNSKIIGTGKKTAYALVLEADVPKRSKLFMRIKPQLAKLEKKLGVRISINSLDSSRF
ncbi:MAG: hypothetical protein A3C35_05990 [Omnitrophica bacterium RIFCSPHIGHO2_02_FULL_46_11]|nr:MAG: hypothetical protein A3C35_05990 [Omnitrophica bacterium RIFCSPHIGHO2_02_FULL_46_11]OGW86334.1 MAG: hypothetical protein A3A81_07610 [Omnitrophica bacterium RIFCSPLOWO2_01_FULL_45_10b]